MIETPRLWLRPWRQEDLPGVTAILADPEVMAFSDNGPLHPDACQRWLAQQIANTDGRGLHAIALKSSGEAIGYIGLTQKAGRTAEAEAEFGIRLAKPFWRQGYASEAALRLLQEAKQSNWADRAIAIVDPANTASVALLRKLGMIYKSEISFPGYDHPDHLYGLSLRSYLYHLLPQDMRGDTLYPLNKLADAHPDLHRRELQKYRGREAVLHQTVPCLDCTWSDVLFLSAVSPSVIKAAMAEAGLCWRNAHQMARFDANHPAFTPDAAVIWSIPNAATATIADNRVEPEAAPYDPANLENPSALPKLTLSYFRDCAQKTQRPLLFLGLPHVLLRGTLDLSDAEILKV